MNKNLLYIIPHPYFYSQCSGIGGHLSHMYGTITAFSENGWNTDILIGDGHVELRRQGYNVLCPMKKGITPWVFSFSEYIKRTICTGAYDLVYMRYSARFSPFIPSISRIDKNLPLVLEINSLGSQRGVLFKYFDRRCLKLVSLPIVVSSKLREFIASKVSNELSKRVLVLTNGVDPKRFDEPNLDRSNNEIVIGYVGVLKPDYGLTGLLESFKILNRKLPNSRLVIIGEGPYRKHLEAIASEGSSGKNIDFSGAVPYEEVPKMLRNFDILIYTTSKKNIYQSPIKIYEYMCARIPIIAAKTPLTSKLIPHLQSSLLYEINDRVDQQISDLVFKLVESPELSEKLSSNAYNTVISEHTWSKKIQLLQNVLVDRGILR